MLTQVDGKKSLNVTINDVLSPPIKNTQVIYKPLHTGSTSYEVFKLVIAEPDNKFIKYSPKSRISRK